MSGTEFRKLRAAMIAWLHERGTRIVTGIDSGLNPWLAHGNLHIALSFLLEAGFTPAAALAAATSEAAGVCGMGDHKGFLRAGYDADIVVAEGDLRTDVSALQHIRAVFLAGTPTG